ncbi:hypothetical protein EYC59_04925 [Candidatus Saccharibacteria bacterium]|nr:MAG: hypothetical protein EYC59_04925 [Candidatus Saccharibacteria bacterium]
MPIIVPELNGSVENDPLYTALLAEQVPVITASDALHQDMRPARIGLLNLMPTTAMAPTELQWLRHVGQSFLQIDPVLIKFDDDPRGRWEDAEESPLLRRYMPFSVATEEPLDGLIVTGANLETVSDQDGMRRPLAFHDIHFQKELAAIVDWADSNIPFTIYSCLASHFALHHRYDLQREITPTKTFGVFAHDRTDSGMSSAITKDMNDRIRAPHSRWGNILAEELERVRGLSVLAISAEAGWLLAEAPNRAGGIDLYVQGHPEYQRGDLDSEYRRDAASGQAMPVGYYRNNDPTQGAELNWKSDARALHANWIDAVYRCYSQG